jgi:hypothetical protein
MRAAVDGRRWRAYGARMAWLLRHSHPVGIAVLAIAGAVLGACAEDGVSTPGGVAPEGVVDAVELALRFELEDLGAIADTVAVERVELGVGAVFLEPIDGASSASFASREPFALVFDAAAGSLEVDGPSIVLPEGGTYAVSILVEPGATAFEADDKDGQGRISVGVDGRLRSGSVIADEPTPLPWRPKSIDRLAVEDQWRPFAFRSDDAMRIQLAEVTLDDAGHYELRVSIRLSGWLVENLLPAVSALLTTTPAVAESEQGASDEPPVAIVDDELAETVEIDALLGDIGVTARPF